MEARSVGTFVQLGDMAVNMTHVVEIDFDEECIHLYLTPRQEDVVVVLRGDERLAFLDWWERRAKITRAAQSRYLAGG